MLLFILLLSLALSIFCWCVLMQKGCGEKLAALLLRALLYEKKSLAHLVVADEEKKKQREPKEQTLTWALKASALPLLATLLILLFCKYLGLFFFAGP